MTFSIIKKPSKSRSSRKVKMKKGAADKQSTFNIQQSNITSYLEQGLYKVDGQLKNVIQLILSSSVYPQKIFALGGAISLLSLAIGSKYKTEDDIYANIYITAIGPTGCGKDAPRSAVKKLANQISFPEKIVDNIASGPGLEDYLLSLSSPETLLMVDEFGTMLQQRKSTGEDHGVTGILLKLYSSVNSNYVKRLKAGESPTAILNPFVSMYGATTEETLQDALSEADAESGWIGRLLFLRSNLARPRFKQPVGFEDKARIEFIEWYESAVKRAIKSFPGTPDIVFRVVVPYSKTATRKLITFQHKTDEYLRSETLNPITRASSVRLTEMVKKLSLISAVSRNPKYPIISIFDVKWAISVTNYSREYITSVLSPRLENNEAESLESRQMKKCLGIIQRACTFNDSQFRKATKIGYMPKRMLLKKMCMKSRTVNACIDTLIESGQITDSELTKEEHGINCDIAYKIHSR